jgi:hypothetical protein
MVLTRYACDVRERRMGMDGGRTVTGSNPAEALCVSWCPDTEAAHEARRLVWARFTAWNRADSVAMRSLMHVPHATLFGSRLAICESESALEGSAELRGPASSDDWHHSRLERLEIRQASDDKVHCAIAFGKEAADGRRYADADAVFVVARAVGRWGIVLNSITMRPIGVGGGEHPAAVAVTANLFQRWLAARDAADVDGMRQLVHLPFVELRGTRLVVHRNAAALRRDAARATPADAWPRRVIQRVETRERSPHKVALEADVVGFGPGGSTLDREAALVIATNAQGRWALQAVSMC